MSLRRLPVALVLVAATAAALILYYRLHKPFSGGQAQALAHSAVNLAVAGWITWLAGGVGRRVLRRLEAPSPGERVLLDTAVGWGLLALVMLGLGLARLYHWTVAWVLAVAVTLWVWRASAAWWRDLGDSLRAIWPRGRAEWLAGGMVVLLLAFGLLRALAPPVMWDALVYHLALPERYVAARGVWLSFQDFSLFFGMPQISEMLYTAALLLHGPLADGGLIAAQTLGWAFGAAMVIGAAALAQRLGLSGVWAATFLLSSFTIVLSLAWAYADLLPMLFAVAMLTALYRWREQPTRGWLLLAGVLGGLAWGGKYTGAIVPLAGALVASGLAAEQRANRGWAQVLRPGLIVGSAAALTFAPWLVKNWLHTGSPVYPLLLPAADMDALRQWFFSRPDLAQSGLGGLGVFWRAVFLGVQGGNEYDATLGPLVAIWPGVLLAAWFYVDRDGRRRLWPLFVFAGAAYVGWVALTYVSGLAVQPRLFFAVLPALALLSAAGLEAVRRLDNPSLRVSWVLTIVTLFVLVLSALESLTFFINHNPLPYLAGSQSASDYRWARLGWYEAAMQHLGALPDDARVLYLWEPRSVGCPQTVVCVPDVSIDRWWHARRTVGAAPAIVDQWRAAGASHLLIYEAGANFAAADVHSPLEPADWTALAALRTRLTWVSAIGPAYTLYAIP